VTFAYDPTLITVRPDLSGFVGQFSNNPAIDVPYNPSGVYPEFDAMTFPGARAGAVWSLAVGPDTVTLDFDFSANPAPFTGATHQNFFGLFLETSRPLAGWQLNTTSTGQFRELGSPTDQRLTFARCSDGASTYACGEVTTLGMTASEVPEPASCVLLGSGLLSVVCRRWRAKARK